MSKYTMNHSELCLDGKELSCPLAVKENFSYRKSDYDLSETVVTVHKFCGLWCAQFEVGE